MNPSARLVAMLALAAACSRAPTPSAAPFPVGDQSPDVVAGIQRMRAATARFANLDSAVAAGYPRDVPQCFANGSAGAMGFHHVNRGYVDARLDLEKPEILIYERLADGRYVLNGVEFIIPFRIWPADSTAPVLIGQRLKPYPDLRIWSVHMWIWKQNPSGLFADWNPTVHCPTATTMSH